jgi:hypothetical protein
LYYYGCYTGSNIISCGPDPLGILSIGVSGNLNVFKTMRPETIHRKEFNLNEKKKELTLLLFRVSEAFFSEDTISYPGEAIEGKVLKEILQRTLDKNIRDFYKNSDLSELVERLDASDSDVDEKALHLVTIFSQGDSRVTMDEDTVQIACELPNFHKAYENETGQNPGARCTLAGSLLHIALEKLGYEGVRCVQVDGHYVVLREMDDGSIKVYDPTASNVTQNAEGTREVKGFAHTFGREDVMKKFEEDNTYQLVLKSSARIEHTDLFSVQDSEGNYVRGFYALNPHTLMDVGTALENLSLLKDSTDATTRVLCEKYPDLKTLDFQEIKRVLQFPDVSDVLPTNEDMNVPRLRAA